MAGLGTLPKVGKLGGSKAAPAKSIPTPPPVTATPSRPPTGFRRPTRFPRGPKLLGLGQRRRTEGGPGEPPPGFVTGTTSAVEWVLYWASWEFFHLPGDPRTPPYTGDGIHFEFQSPENPAQPRELGGGVSDFVYFLGTGTVIVRLDTWYFHITASPEQQARDATLKQRAHRMNARVATLYDTQILGDPTGNAAVKALADVLAGREMLSPARSGLAYAVRNEVTGQVPA